MTCAVSLVSLIRRRFKMSLPTYGRCDGAGKRRSSRLLSELVTLAASGVLPENVKTAVKGSYLLSFLESVPEVSARLKEANGKEMKFEDVVKSAEQAAVLVLVY